MAKWSSALVFILAICAAAFSSAEADHSRVGPQLPPKLRGLLILEMNAITEASQRIWRALVIGDDALVAENAQAIHDSFILEQSLTEAEHTALHKALPHAFIERDMALHGLAEALAVAARQGDQTRQRALFSDMLGACVDCHAHHAQDRFPALKVDKVRPPAPGTDSQARPKPAKAGGQADHHHH